MVQQRIQKLLGITADQYAEYVWDLGLKYAYHYTNEDDEAVRFMTQCKSYWAWWQNQFDLIDEQFIACYGRFENPASREAIINAWLYDHSPSSLRAFPGSMVMEETYARMIGEAFDEANSRRVAK